ncbi:MAG: hypothetical protein NT001_03415 [Candidatus Woesearchaeota archaeon]|nr:hypothetical protein [Candidatus Woesearchaeota archaeon]
MIAVLAITIACAFALAKGGSVTGYSVLNPNQPYEIPVYLTTFMILVIIMLFLILTVFTLDHHARGIRIKEDDKVGRIFKKY